MNIQFLKDFAIDRILDIDEAIAISAQMRCLEVEFVELGIPQPEWLSKASDTLRTEIARRVHANDLAEMQRLEGLLDSYKSVTERKTEVQGRLAALQSKLGMGAKSPKRARQ